MEILPINYEDVKQNSSNSFLHQNLSIAEAQKNPEQLATQFEAYFYRLLLKEMRESTLDEDSLFNSFEMDNMRQMQDDELAGLLAAQGHLGIKNMMLEHLSTMESQSTYPPDQFNVVKQGLLKPNLKEHKGVPV